MKTLVVVDYGMGNLRSVAKAFEWVAHEAQIAMQVEVSDQPKRIEAADRVVFPGQGAMPDCMRNLRDSGLETAVRDAAASKPFFGVCVGMQMLFERSEEGDTAGLGLVPGVVRRFRPDDRRLKVPHMGWNLVTTTRTHPLLAEVIGADGERFYFVHSYYCDPSDDTLTVAVADYGHRFTAALARHNIFATQFHPEKSHRAGLALYRRFLTWNPPLL